MKILNEGEGGVTMAVNPTSKMFTLYEMAAV